MILRRIAAGTPPITLADAKEHLRVTGTDEDDLITGYIAAACGYVSEASGRALSEETWMIAEEGFCDEVTLPKSPVRELVSVKYYLNDTLTTATLADYRLYLSDDYSEVAPVYGKIWPVAQIREDGTQITFKAGYVTLPAELRQAVFLMLAFLYANRGDEAVSPPPALDWLIGAHRLGWVAG